MGSVGRPDAEGAADAPMSPVAPAHRASAARLFFVGACTFGFVAPWFGFFFSRGLPALMLVSVLVLLPAHRKAHGAWPRIDTGFAALFGALVLYGGLTSLWSVVPILSLAQAGEFAYIFAGALLLHAMLRSLDDGQRRLLAAWLAAGTVLALALVAADRAMGLPALTILHRIPPNLADAYYYNKLATALALLMWPAAMAGQGHRLARAGALVVLGAAVVGFATGSLSALVAIATGTSLAVLALASPRLARGLVLLVVAGGFVAGPSIATLMAEDGLSAVSWLPFSASHRIDIWAFVATLIDQHPWIGWGLDSARVVQATAESARFQTLHPHNLFLQILLELGLPGALLMVILTWVILRRIDRLPAGRRSLGYGSIGAALGASTFAWGIWQTWWMVAMLITGVMIAVLGTRPVADRGPGEVPR